MGRERYKEEWKQVSNMQSNVEGPFPTNPVPGEDPGLAASDLTDSVADSVVGEGKPYLPTESLREQVTSLMVYGTRLGGPIGSLLRVASHAIDVAVLYYEEEYGPWLDGASPKYLDE